MGNVAAVKVSEWKVGGRNQLYSYWKVGEELFVAEFDEAFGFEVGGLESEADYEEGVVYDWAYLEKVDSVDDFDEEYADHKVREFLAA